MNHKYLLIAFLSLLLPLSSRATEYVKRSDLPCIYIDTWNSASITSKETYIYADLHYVDEQGEVTAYDSLQIRGRGNSTWSKMSKKSYRIKFKQKEKFLGKGYAKAKSWTLLANAGDKTMFRNALTMMIGKYTSLEFNPAYKFVDLVLNNTYMGTYQISDQIQVKKKRVNVAEQDYPLTTESNITGGYLLEVDGFKDFTFGKSGFYTSNEGVPVNVHYPDDDEIVSRQLYYIWDHVQAFEDALYSDDFADAEKGYRAYVDTMSLLDWYLCTEISANIDGFYSTYFYKEQDDPHLYWGPLWDYDIAYGNDHRKGDTVEQLMVDVGYGVDDGCRAWFEQMWKDPWFQQAVYDRYVKLLNKGLKNYVVNAIDSLQRLLYESQQLNYAKWGISTKAYHERVLYSSYDQYVSDLQTYCDKRLSFLKTAFAERIGSGDDDDDDDESGAFVPDDDYFYHIINVGSLTVFDLANQSTTAGTAVCAWQELSTRETQDWKFSKVGDYFAIINRCGLALADPTEGYADATTGTGWHLEIADYDGTDDRQLWTVKRVGTTDHFNIINKHTDHCVNLSGGSNANGTGIISYTNDAKNTTSNNRQWMFEKSTKKTSTAIYSPEPEEYALAYDAQGQRLHFGSATPDQLTFTATVFNASGQRVGSFRADSEFSTASLPSGAYVVSWTVGGKRRTAKLAIR